MIIAITNAMILAIKTAAAVKSFIFLIRVLYFGETKLARFSIAVFMVSVTNTIEIESKITVHSSLFICKTKDVMITSTEAKMWIRKLCSSKRSILNPFRAYLKLRNRSFMEKIELEIFIISKFKIMWKSSHHPR